MQYINEADNPDREFIMEELQEIFNSQNSKAEEISEKLNNLLEDFKAV